VEKTFPVKERKKTTVERGILLCKKDGITGIESGG
jgi:hypothetical protein